MNWRYKSLFQNFYKTFLQAFHNMKKYVLSTVILKYDKTNVLMQLRFDDTRVAGAKTRRK